MGCIESSGSLAGSLPSSPILLPSSLPSPPLLPFLFIAVIRFQPPPFGEKAKKRGCDTVAKRPPSRLMDEIPLLSPSFFRLEPASISTRNRRFFRSIPPRLELFFPGKNFCQIGFPYTDIDAPYVGALYRCSAPVPRSPQTSLRSSLRQPFPRPDPANLFHAFFPILFPRPFLHVLICRD